VPCFRSCVTFLTFVIAAVPYFRGESLLDAEDVGVDMNDELSRTEYLQRVRLASRRRIDLVARELCWKAPYHALRVPINQ
jgi:hypothetical protein